MTIEQIDNDRILIALCDDDMKAFSLEFESMSLSDPHVREIMRKLLHLASTETGISVKNKKTLIEAVPYINGCLLFITLSRPKAHERKIYKIKNISPIIIGFAEAEDMLRCTAVMYKAGIKSVHSDLYKLGSRYFLVIRTLTKIPRRLEALLCEYGEKIPGGRLTAARLSEYGKSIALNNAAEVIGSALSEKKEKNKNTA